MKRRVVSPAPVPIVSQEVLQSMRTNIGLTVADLCKHHRVLLFFIRFIDCGFCQYNIIKYISEMRNMLQMNTLFIVVHQETEEVATPFFTKDSPLPQFVKNAEYITKVIRVSDPEHKFYRTFGVTETNMPSNMTPMILFKMLIAVARGYVFNFKATQNRLNPGSLNQDFNQDLFILSHGGVKAHWKYDIQYEA